MKNCSRLITTNCNLNTGFAEAIITALCCYPYSYFRIILSLRKGFFSALWVGETI